MTNQRSRTIASPIGELTLVASDDGVTNILFDGEEPQDFGLPENLESAAADPILDAAADQLGEYFEGGREAFDIPLDLHGTSFQKAAWLALAEVPYGSTISYGAQAAAIGRPGAARAIGAANGQNPIPIVLPCHRIIGADGSLTGFGGGLDVKQKLLDLERSQQTLPGL
jgi:methylated-DNA-[protein]-cysteine S-methyltransferase